MQRRIDQCHAGQLQAGASLVEAMAALAVMAMVAASLSIWVQEQQRQERAMRAGAEMLTMWDGAFRLTSKNYSTYLNDFSGGVAVKTGAKLFKELNPDLPETSPTNPYGQGYCLLLKQLVNPARVEGLLLTTGGVAMDGGQQAVAIQTGGPGIGLVTLNNGSLEARNGSAADPLWWRAIDASNRASIVAKCGADVSTGGLAGIFTVMAPEASASLLYRVSLAGSDGAPLTTLNTLANDVSVRGNIAAGAMATSAQSCSAGTPGKNAAGELAECSGSGSWITPAWASGDWMAAVRPGSITPRLRQVASASALINTDCAVLGIVTRDTDGTVIGCQKPKGSSQQQWLRMGGKGIYVETLAAPINLLASVTQADKSVKNVFDIDIKNLQGIPSNVRLYIVMLVSTYMCTNCWSSVHLTPKGTIKSAYPTISSQNGGFITQLMIDPSLPGYDWLNVDWWHGQGAPYTTSNMEFKITGFVCEGDVCTY